MKRKNDAHLQWITDWQRQRSLVIADTNGKITSIIKIEDGLKNRRKFFSGGKTTIPIGWLVPEKLSTTWIDEFVRRKMSPSTLSSCGSSRPNCFETEQRKSLHQGRKFMFHSSPSFHRAVEPPQPPISTDGDRTFLVANLLSNSLTERRFRSKYTRLEFVWTSRAMNDDNHRRYGLICFCTPLLSSSTTWLQQTHSTRTLVRFRLNRFSLLSLRLASAICTSTMWNSPPFDFNLIDHPSPVTRASIAAMFSLLTFTLICLLLPLRGDASDPAEDFQSEIGLPFPEAAADLACLASTFPSASEFAKKQDRTNRCFTAIVPDRYEEIREIPSMVYDPTDQSFISNVYPLLGIKGLHLKVIERKVSRRYWIGIRSEFVSPSLESRGGWKTSCFRPYSSSRTRILSDRWDEWNDEFIRSGSDCGSSTRK